MARIDTAQICLNGHIINKYSEQCPEYNKNFCEECGEQSIIKCQNCNHKINWVSENEAISPFLRPSYCGECGIAFPWIKIALDSAKEILDIDNKIGSDDKEKLMKSINEITKDTSKTEINAFKIKNIAKILSKDTYSIFMKIVSSIGTELARKILLS